MDLLEIDDEKETLWQEEEEDVVVLVVDLELVLVRLPSALPSA
jgi:hypothetical protein